MKDLPVGQYKLHASYLGYEDQTIEFIIVQPNQENRVNLHLRPVPLPIEEVVVTASLRSQAIKLAPASIGIITNKQLQDRQVTTFDQAFDDMPGVVVTRSTGANVQSFSIRGASEVAGGGIGNRVLLLLDGRPAIKPIAEFQFHHAVGQGRIAGGADPSDFFTTDSGTLGAKCFRKVLGIGCCADVT